MQLTRLSRGWSHDIAAAYRFVTASIVGYHRVFLRHHPSKSNTQELRQMPKGTIKFTCLRINLKRISTFEPDESQIGSLIEFDLKIGNRRLNALSVEVRQRYGTDFQNEPLEVGNVIGYNGPWNSEEFRDLCGQYYRDIIGSSGVGRAIKRGERKLIERVAIRVDRREEINLPSSAETMANAKPDNVDLNVKGADQSLKPSTFLANTERDFPADALIL
jgi:hypothetical protein